MTAQLWSMMNFVIFVDIQELLYCAKTHMVLTHAGVGIHFTVQEHKVLTHAGVGMHFTVQERGV